VADPEAMERFQALYADHHAAVYAYAVSRVGRQLADEVVSETFLVAWRRLADVPAPALPWLLTVARNTACSQFRGTARQRSIGAELRAWVTEAELSAPDVADEVAERTAVLAALATLPEADRELLTLVAWHGLKPAEAAQVVGCSTAAYFVRLHRARRRLERAMADPPEPAMADPPERSVAGLPGPAGPPEPAMADPPERSVAGLPGPAGPPEPAGSPDSARLGDPVLAHREEQAR
jgi:RNA polymerase sigma-70 factor, ECF subfamily